MSSYQAGPDTKSLEEATTSESQAFDYSTLDPQARALVQECASEIKSLTRRTSLDIVRIGENLLTVRKQFKYGKFTKWVKTEFGWSRRQAYNYINSFESFGSCANFAQLDIGSSALYHLSEPATPEAARQEALQRARRGETITCSKARKIVERYRNPPILPEVLPPELPLASTGEKCSPPLVTISISPEAAPLLEPGIEGGDLEKGLQVEAGAKTDAQDSLDVKSDFQCQGQLEQEIDWKAGVTREYTQAPDGLQTASSPIQVLSIEVDESKLREDVMQVFEVVSPGFHVQFRSLAGTAVSLFQQLKEFPSLAKKYVA